LAGGSHQFSHVGGNLGAFGTPGVQHGSDLTRFANLLQGGDRQWPTGGGGGLFPSALQNLSNMYDPSRRRARQDNLLNQTLLQQFMDTSSLQQQQQLLEVLRPRSSAPVQLATNNPQAMGFPFPPSMSLGRSSIGPSFGPQPQSLAGALDGNQQEQHQQLSQSAITLEALRRYQAATSSEQKDGLESSEQKTESLARGPTEGGAQDSASSPFDTSPSSSGGNGGNGNGGSNAGGGGSEAV
jgi:hypothetical protein